jgi:2-hydroxy-3-keto-5-methylthiopentenyl-1-phosphate phosphatase
MSDHMSIAVLADFDKTVTASDASYAILDNFASGEWRQVEAEAYTGRYTILEALTIQAAMVRGAPEEIDALVLETVSIREGFAEFADLCRSNDIHLEICSDGFAHTIPLVLGKEGLDWIPYSSNRTWYKEGGLAIAFDHHMPYCPINGNCKCHHYDRLMAHHDTVVYVGDGGTDACVAARAQVLYARDWLAHYCSGKGIAFTPWSEWSDVWKGVSRLFGPMDP